MYNKYKPRSLYSSYSWTSSYLQTTQTFKNLLPYATQKLKSKNLTQRKLLLSVSSAKLMATPDFISVTVPDAFVMENTMIQNKCTKDRNSSTKCALCSSDHSASYKDCLSQKEFQKTTKPLQKITGSKTSILKIYNNQSKPNQTN